MKASLTARLIIIFLCVTCFSSAYSQEYIESLKIENKSGSYVLIQEGRTSYAFGQTDSEEEIKWKVPVDGLPYGMSYYNGNIIVVYAPMAKLFAPMTDVRVMLIDLQKKKSVKDISIFKNQGSNQVSVKMNATKKKEFCNILVRETESAAGLSAIRSGGPGSLRKSNKISIIRFKNDLIPESEQLKGAALEADFIASSVRSCNTIFLCFYKDGKIITEEFDEKGDKKGELTTDFSPMEKSDFTSIFFYDSLQTHSINLVLSFTDDDKKSYINLYKFDFVKNEVSRSEEVAHNKEYLKVLKASNPGITNAGFSKIRALHPVQLIFTADKTILIKEIRTSGISGTGRSQEYYSGGVVISFYSKVLKLIKEIPIDKWSQNGLMAFTQVGGHIKGNNLYVVTNEKDGQGFKTIIYVINLDDYTITSKKIQDPQSGLNWVTKPLEIIWYENYFMVPFIHSKISLKMKTNTEWVKEKY